MTAPAAWTLTGLAGLGLLVARRLGADARAARTEAALLAADAPPEPFAEARLDGLPEPARRYLRHAIAPGSPLAPAVRLTMTGALAPRPGAPRVALSATEALAPRRGFVWTARATMSGLPVRVRDTYHEGAGRLAVTALALVPVPAGGASPDVTRSARGRLGAEAVWCPTALVHPSVAWEGRGPDRARYTLPIDGEGVSVDVRVGPGGALREVSMERWGDADGGPFRPLPYGFGVEAEGTFGGVTIPTRLTGGWFWGTDRFAPEAAASFTVHAARFATGPPPEP